MAEFLDRVPAVGREGYRKLTIKEVGTSGLTTDSYFTAQVEFDDSPTVVGTPYARSNIATQADVTTGTDNEKLVTPYALAEALSQSINEDTSLLTGNFADTSINSSNQINLNDVYEVKKVSTIGLGTPVNVTLNTSSFGIGQRFNSTFTEEIIGINSIRLLYNTTSLNLSSNTTPLDYIITIRSVTSSTNLYQMRINGDDYRSFCTEGGFEIKFESMVSITPGHQIIVGICPINTYAISTGYFTCRRIETDVLPNSNYVTSTTSDFSSSVTDYATYDLYFEAEFVYKKKTITGTFEKVYSIKELESLSSFSFDKTLDVVCDLSSGNLTTIGSATGAIATYTNSSQPSVLLAKGYDVRQPFTPSVAIEGKLSLRINLRLESGSSTSGILYVQIRDSALSQVLAECTITKPDAEFAYGDYDLELNLGSNKLLQGTTYYLYFYTSRVENNPVASYDNYKLGLVSGGSSANYWSGSAWSSYGYSLYYVLTGISSTVIASNITSPYDLRALNVSSFSYIRAKFTLSRTLKTDTTPTISNISLKFVGAPKSQSYFKKFKSNTYWICPADGFYKITLCGGGGASGRITASGVVGNSGSSASGVKTLFIKAGTVIKVLVGRGGYSETTGSSSMTYASGRSGCTSSFGDYCSIYGGGAGLVYSTNNTVNGSGPSRTGISIFDYVLDPGASTQYVPSYYTQFEVPCILMPYGSGRTGSTSTYTFSRHGYPGVCIIESIGVSL